MSLAGTSCAYATVLHQYETICCGQCSMYAKLCHPCTWRMLELLLSRTFALLVRVRTGPSYWRRHVAAPASVSGSDTFNGGCHHEAHRQRQHRPARHDRKALTHDAKRLFQAYSNTLTSILCS